jgi:hypothetical protein
MVGRITGRAGTGAAGALTGGGLRGMAILAMNFTGRMPVPRTGACPGPGARMTKKLEGGPPK